MTVRTRLPRSSIEDTSDHKGEVSRPLMKLGHVIKMPWRRPLVTPHLAGRPWSPELSRGVAPGTTAAAAGVLMMRASPEGLSPPGLSLNTTAGVASDGTSSAASAWRVAGPCPPPLAASLAVTSGGAASCCTAISSNLKNSTDCSSWYPIARWQASRSRCGDPN